MSKSILDQFNSNLKLNNFQIKLEFQLVDTKLTIKFKPILGCVSFKLNLDKIQSCKV